MPHNATPDPATLARAFVIDLEAEPWAPRDTAAMLEHQLAAPLDFDLRQIYGISKATIDELVTEAEPPILNFGDLLQHDRPPLALLQLAKDFAKSRYLDVPADFPRDVALLLYYGLIAAALARHGQRITRLEDHALHRGLQWAADHAACPATLRQVLRDGLQALGHA